MKVVHRYESADGIPLPVEMEARKTPPLTVTEGGVRYRLAHHGADMAEIRASLGGLATAVSPATLVRGATTRKMHDRVFESHQLPRWDPDAPAHNPKNGKPRFKNSREIREYEAKKRHKEGLDIRYGEL